MSEREKLKKRNDDQIERGCGNRLSDLSANEVAALLSELEQAERSRQKDADLLIELAERLDALQIRCNEGYAAHAASFGALAEISLLTHLEGEVDNYSDVVKAVAKIEAALRTLREASADLQKSVEMLAKKSIGYERDESIVMTMFLEDATNKANILAAALAAEGGK